MIDSIFEPYLLYSCRYMVDVTESPLYKVAADLLCSYTFKNKASILGKFFSKEGELFIKANIDNKELRSMCESYRITSGYYAYELIESFERIKEEVWREFEMPDIVNASASLDHHALSKYLVDLLKENIEGVKK